MARFTQACDRVRLYGQEELLVANDLRPDYLASLMAPFIGKTQFVTATSESVLDTVDGSHKKKDLLQAVHYRLGHLSLKNTQAVNAGASSVYRGVLEAGGVLMLPFGWLLSAMTVGSHTANVHGLTMSSHPSVCIGRILQCLEQMKSTTCCDLVWVDAFLQFANNAVSATSE